MPDHHEDTVTQQTADTPKVSAEPEAATDAQPESVASAEAEAAAPEDAEEAAPAEKAEESTPEEAAEAAAEAVPEVEAAAEEAAPEAEAAAEEAAPEAEVAAEEAAPEAEAAAEEAAPEVEAAAPEAEAAAEEAAPEAEAATPEAEATAETTADADAEDGQPDATMLMLEKALAEKAMVEGQVIGWNKGGYHVAIDKVAAFCPVSQIEIGNPRSPKRYLDKSFQFHVIEIQKGGRRVVLSRAAALTAEREAKAAVVREHLKPGTKVEGKISSLTDFGAFVDLGGGIEGLIHVSEISRQRVEHPKEALKTGQEVKVQVLRIEKGGQRISLSLKRLEADPWKGVAERFPPGSQFTGKILRKTDFGLFVELQPGLEGLIHTSRLPHGATMESEDLEVGKEVSGWIHEVEGKRRRVSLSLREVAGGNPWKGVSDRYPVGDVVKGTVERLASFGAFIELEPGLTGLLPFSTLPTGANPRRQYHAGKEVSVRVLSIDRDKRRISLGTEQSKAEGSQQDYREYLKTEKKRKKGSSDSGGFNAMASAFAKLKDPRQEQSQ